MTNKLLPGIIKREAGFMPPSYWKGVVFCAPHFKFWLYELRYRLYSRPLCPSGRDSPVVGNGGVPRRQRAEPVGGLGQGLGGQVYREFTVFFDKAVGVPLGPDGNVADGRVRAQDPRPSHRNQVVVFLARPAAHQDRRQRINHRPRFEVHFAHGICFIEQYYGFSGNRRGFCIFAALCL